MPDDEVSLREYVDEMAAQAQALHDAKFDLLRALIDSQQDKVAIALASADRAVLKAETATERRFESVNEFRAQLTDQAATFITRREFEQVTGRIGDFADRREVDDLKSRLDIIAGRSAGQFAFMTIGLAVLTLVVIAANAFFR